MSSELSLALKRYRYPFAASALILCGVVLRLVLLAIGWPQFNSEEGTMGLEAMHILLRGEHPIYFYGQNYMGVGEAYVAALTFRLFGISVVTLRLGMLIFYVIFMVGVFWLADQLYSRRVALLSLVVLDAGTPFLMQIELRPDGGKIETLAFGALLFALAAWLALSEATAPSSRRHRALRLAVFATWGLIAGLGLYTYLIIAPFVATSGLLLVITCWRELRGWAFVLLMSGLLVGLLPALIYSATMPLSDNPISVFLTLHQTLNAGAPVSRHLVAKQVDGTLLYTLPTVTGLVNLYPVQALPLYGPLRKLTLIAIAVGGGWSLGYLLLLGLTIYRPLATLRADWMLSQALRDSYDDVETAATPMTRPDRARILARLLLPLTAVPTIAAYMFSETAANDPASGRYMIGLLVIVPAVLWSVVDRPFDLDVVIPARPLWSMLRGFWRPVAMAVLIVSLVLGVGGVVVSVPKALAGDTTDTQFAHDLLHHGITRFYSDYWTCDKLNFETQERLICAVIQTFGQPGRTRYLPYWTAVQADKSAPYVLVRGSVIESTFLTHAREADLQFAVKRLDEYDVYTPVSK